MELTLGSQSGLHEMIGRALSTVPSWWGVVLLEHSAVSGECLVVLLPDSENLLETFRVYSKTKDRTLHREPLEGNFTE